MLGGVSWFGPASAAHTGLTGAQSVMATTASGSLIQKAAVINDYALVLEVAQRQAKKAIERAKRIEAYGSGTGWYLEVLDGELGLWTVEAAGEGEVTLTPTDATAVLDELAALPGHVGLGPS